jgi:O-acetyl-ADP-ribose deacetylase (regulator of RNase III)
MSFAIEIQKLDITKADTEAIVNAANNEFWMGSGVAGAIKSAGGDVIEEEAINKGPVMPGEVIYTGAGRLPFKYILHAAVMGQNLKTSDQLIRKATVGSLLLAEKLNLSSIAFPAFGTGVGGFPMQAAAHIMVRHIATFRPNAKSLTRVVFCLFDEYGFELFRRQAKVDRLI